MAASYWRSSFAVAVILRIIALATPPNFLSTDVYRYVWDGRVQGAGINPYLYIPSDPAVASLRDNAIYPHINRLYTAPTIYPPFAQMVFFAITRFAESVNSMRLAMLGFEAIAVLALAVLLKRQRLPVHRLALYLWHPLPVWEFACGAHVDAVVLAMSLLAIIAAMSNRRSLSGALLAAAALTKFLPVAIAPALYRRWDWRMPAAFLVVVVCSYALYLSAGWKVLGFLESYAAEEGMTQGQGVFIAMLLQDIGLAPLPALLGFAAIAAAVLGTMVIRALSRNRDMEAMPALAGALAIATLVLISPHYPWYFCWLVPFICFLPRASLIYLTSAVFYLYLTDEPFEPLDGPRDLRSRTRAVRFRAAPVFRAAPATRIDPVTVQPRFPDRQPRAISRRSRQERDAHAAKEPVCLYLETTNRCNLLCTTCPRTFEELEPPADMSWELFTRSSTSFRASRASSCTASASR